MVFLVLFHSNYFIFLCRTCKWLWCKWLPHFLSSLFPVQHSHITRCLFHTSPYYFAILIFSFSLALDTHTSIYAVGVAAAASEYGSTFRILCFLCIYRERHTIACSITKSIFSFLLSDIYFMFDKRDMF